MGDSTAPRGLTSGEAARRLAVHGPNAIESQEKRGLLRTVAAVVTEPMFGLLLSAAAIYLALGDLGEGLLLAFFAVMTVALVVLQERRSERAIDALRDLAAPQVRVLRDGVVRQLPARDLVPGDLFLVGEGERVAADAVLRQATHLSVDEALLTGESVPVRKRAQAAGDPAPAEPGGDDQPWAYASTLVVDGHGLAEVMATGAASRVGQIGASLAAIELTATPLQLHLQRLVRWLAAGGLALSVLLVLWWGLSQGEWLQGVLAGIALAMALLPEEFPMALAVFLALGAWRLARVKVLARRPAVIEALGATSVLCLDKTGTLTENRMHLRRLVAVHAQGDVGVEIDLAGNAPTVMPAPARRLLEVAVLASRRGGMDPMDNAVVARGDSLLDTGDGPLHAGWRLAQAYPLTPQLMAMTQAWVDAQGRPRVAAKGAPEAIAQLCHLDEAQSARLLAQVRALADQGLRVLAVAEGVGTEPVAADHHDYDLQVCGLLAFEDPLRASVPAAVAQARRAGIAVAMITGDHPATALAIARQAGIEVAAGALTGEQVRAMADAPLAEAVRRVRVFARVAPADKLRLVQALRANGETVAMTGDGVNDAPALKAAHIGIAMGVRGTDVAREAASVVLLDEDFGRIVDGVRVGRRIYDNLRKVMTYIMAIHVPIAGLALLPVMFGLPPMMLPVHVVVTEMIIDPVCSLAFEKTPPARGLMERPPRPGSEPLVSWSLVVQALLQGGSLLAAALAVYVLSLRSGVGADQARTLAFIGLTAGNLLLVWFNASAGLGMRALLGRDFALFWIVGAVAAGLLALAVLVPEVRTLMKFGVPPLHLLALSVGSVMAAVAAGVWAARALRAGMPI